MVVVNTPNKCLQTSLFLGIGRDQLYDSRTCHVRLNSCLNRKTNSSNGKKSNEVIITYIIGHYNASVRIIDQFLTTLVLCELILYISGGDLQFKVDSE